MAGGYGNQIVGPWWSTTISMWVSISSYWKAEVCMSNLVETTSTMSMFWR